ncbi:MAG: hypothetical protein AAGF12_38575 [Myxococcota bacterium]
MKPFAAEAKGLDQEAADGLESNQKATEGLGPKPAEGSPPEPPFVHSEGLGPRPSTEGASAPRRAVVVLVRFGAVLLLLGALSAIWEILASQAPSSPYHVGVLPGPVEQLRITATFLGFGSLAAAWLLPWIAPRRDPWTLIGVYATGVVVTLAVMTYAANTGMYGIQIADPRPDSRVLFWLRASGQTLILGALIEFVRRLLVRRPSFRTR